MGQPIAGDSSVAQQIDAGNDGRDRSAQLVRQDAQKGVALPFLLDRVGHVAYKDDLQRLRRHWESSDLQPTVGRDR